MSTVLKYMPIFRARQEEIKVLKNFNFGNEIYPCVEIIKELIRQQPKPRNGTKKPLKPRKKKLFEDDYLKLISDIKSKHVFVDLPVHLPGKTGMKLDTLRFLQGVVRNREIRTNYIKKLIPLGSKVIPVISTYIEVTGEIGSITIQENDIRPHFPVLAFRTFFKTFFRDIDQIKKIVQQNDYVIMDWDDMELDIEDGDQIDIIDELKELNCNIIVHRSPLSKDITNKGLDHDKVVESINNDHLNNYVQFAGNCFSDYVGIKKDGISSGGSISPGFIYYDAITNNFYGYRYKLGYRELEEFERTIVPAVINSKASQRMEESSLDYLGSDNKGWEIIKNIELGEQYGGESGKNAAKFKRISMEHYIHCLRCQIANGDFD